MPWSNTIADLLNQQGEQGARTAIALADIASRNSLARAAVLNNTVNQIGKALTNIGPERRAEAEQQQEAQYRNLQMQQLSGKLSDEDRARQKQQAAQAILQKYGPDIHGAASEIIRTVDPHLGLAIGSEFDKANAEGFDLAKKKIDAERATNESISQKLGAAGTDQATYTRTRQTLATAGLINPAEWPEDVNEAQPHLKAFNESLLTAEQKLTLQEKRIEDARRAAADAERARKDLAAEANKPPTAEQDTQRYIKIQQAKVLKQPVSPEDAAWASGYEKNKTLSTDASAAAAAARGLELQRNAQDFSEKEAGRKELTDKVEQPYLDAREKASTLRSVIDAAKNGNMEAASVQSLLGTLGLVTTEGVKRINNVELQQVSGAGSLFERIKGAAAKVAVGQPLSAKLQNDLAELAQLLEKSARKKYEEGFGRVTKRYNLADEQIMPPPEEAAPPPSTLTPGLQGLANR